MPMQTSTGQNNVIKNSTKGIITDNRNIFLKFQIQPTFWREKISIIDLEITLKQQQRETYLKISEISNLNPIEKVRYNPAFCTMFTLQKELFAKG